MEIRTFEMSIFTFQFMVICTKITTDSSAQNSKLKRRKLQDKKHIPADSGSML